MDTRGTHVTLDVWFNAMPRCADLESRMGGVLNRFGVTVVGRLRHEFKPAGLTALWLLAESHASMHTYPEANYCSVDIYTCGGIDTEALALAWLAGVAGVRYHRLISSVRGVQHPSA